MGYAHYIVYRNGEEIEAGYTVEDICEEAGCDERIDRGLAHLCGEKPGGDEYGCGGYFCSSHLYLSSQEGHPQMCKGCLARAAA